jgi:hypothetical protein
MTDDRVTDDVPAVDDEIVWNACKVETIDLDRRCFRTRAPNGYHWIGFDEVEKRNGLWRLK